MRPEFLREALRHWREFRTVIQEGGDGVISDPETGESLCYFDMFLGWDTLTERQKQAVFYWVICDMTEQDAAIAMGYDPNRGTAHVRDYAMRGVEKMAKAIEDKHE